MRHYARNIGDLAAATRGLDLLHRGAYDALLDAYYLREQPLPLDHAECYLLADARSPAERRAVDVVLSRFFDQTDDGYRQRRCDRELARFAEKSEKARASAAISADVRRYSVNPSLADVNREKRRSRIAAARELGTHTTEDWDLLVQVCGGVCVRCGSTGRLVRDHIVPIYQGGSDGIDNIQPLCVRCNTSKGPESKDFRPDGWADALSERSANAQRTLSDGSATHDPRPTTHNPKSKSKGAVAAAPLPGWLDQAAWTRFLQARFAMKAAATEYAQALLLRDLERLREQGHDPTAVLDQSVKRGWRGLFAVKADGVGGGGGRHDARAGFANEIIGAVTHGQRPESSDPRDISGEAERVA